jgi:hypothetical protein
MGTEYRQAGLPGSIPIQVIGLHDPSIAISRVAPLGKYAQLTAQSGRCPSVQPRDAPSQRLDLLADLIVVRVRV